MNTVRRTCVGDMQASSKGGSIRYGRKMRLRCLGSSKQLVRGDGEIAHSFSRGVENCLWACRAVCSTAHRTCGNRRFRIICVAKSGIDKVRRNAQDCRPCSGS